MKSEGCPFCFPDADREIIIDSEQCFAIYDKFPVNPGHALVIPKLHCANFFELDISIQKSCVETLNLLKGKIESEFHPDGFNIGININEVAGQTVPHVHIHLIPRYHNDVKEPRGGVRGVIPDKKDY